MGLLRECIEVFMGQSGACQSQFNLLIRPKIQARIKPMGLEVRSSHCPIEKHIQVGVFMDRAGLSLTWVWTKF